MGEAGKVPPVPQVNKNWLLETLAVVTPTRVYPLMQVYTAVSNSVRFADVVFSSLELAGGIGGAGQLTGILQVGMGLGRITLPSDLHGTEKVLPTLVT